MRLVGPSWSFVMVGLIFLAAGAMCAARPTIAWRVRRVADEGDRSITPSPRVLVYLRVIGAVVAIVGAYLLVAVALR